MTFSLPMILKAIASSTNQLWPAFSPRCFAPPLARIPFEHGYPPVPASPFNLWRFSPLLGYYGGKVINKLAAKLGMASKPAAPTARPDDTALMHKTGIAEWRQSTRILQSGLFEEQALRNLLDKNSLTNGPRMEQWRRLVTLEAVLRKKDQ